MGGAGAQRAVARIDLPHLAADIGRHRQSEDAKGANDHQEFTDNRYVFHRESFSHRTDDFMSSCSGKLTHFLHANVNNALRTRPLRNDAAWRFMK